MRCNDCKREVCSCMKVEWNKIRLSVRNQPLHIKLIQEISILNLKKIKKGHDWVNFYKYPKIVEIKKNKT